MDELMELRELVALNIDPDAWADDLSRAAQITRRGPSLHKADCILSIPEIADALRLAKVRGEIEDGGRPKAGRFNLGPSISTNKRTPV